MTCAEFLLQLTLGRSMFFHYYSGCVELDIPRLRTAFAKRHCHMYSTVKGRCSAEMVRLGRRKSFWGKECAGDTHPALMQIHCHS